MKPSEQLRLHRHAVLAIAERHRVAGVRVFGSVARGDDTDDSDLDLLVEPTERTTHFDIGGIQFEVSELLGVRVDVLTPRALPPGCRDEILRQSVPL